jgi:hypothetical protein
MAARVILAQICVRVCLIGPHNAARRGIPLESRAGAAGCGDGVARLRASVMARLLLDDLLGVLDLLDLLGGLAELVQVLAGGQVALHALADDMMALRLVLRGSWVLALGEMRLRGRLSRHGGWPFGPRMGIIGRSHAYVFAVRLHCVCTASCWGGVAGCCLAVGSASSAGVENGRDLVVDDRRVVLLRWQRRQRAAMGLNCARWSDGRWYSVGYVGPNDMRWTLWSPLPARPKGQAVSARPAATTLSVDRGPLASHRTTTVHVIVNTFADETLTPSSSY